MIICKICYKHSPNLNIYNKHLQNHKYHSGNFYCYFSNCAKSYATYSSYIVHYYRKHRTSFNNESTNNYTDIFDDITCEKCNFNLHGKRNIMAHMKQHIYHDGNTKCVFCPKKFKNYNSFKSHVSRSHTFNIVSTDNCDSTPNTNFDSSLPDTEEDIEMNNTASSSNNFNISDSFNLLVFKLKYQHNLPESTIQIIINFLNEVITNTKGKIKNTLNELLNKNLLTSDIFNELSLEMNNIFKMNDRNTTYTRFKQNSASVEYIPPKSVLLGLDDNHKECSYHYVPIIKSIPVLLNNMSHLENIFDKRPTNFYSEYTDFFDGKAYKNNTFFHHDRRLEIMLYVDSFNVAQPLGAAKSTYKIMAVYYAIGNIPRSERFKLKNMQLAILCLESNIKKFGIDAIFDKLIEDLLKIEIEGINIKCDSNQMKNIKGSVIFIIADNLGSHQIGGFFENFSTSKYFCRTCKINLDDFNESHYCRAELRNNNNYSLDANSDEETYGIKTISIFNKLNYFKVCQPGLPPCIAHDLYEGIVAQDVNMYLQYFVSNNWFTFYTINRKFKQIQQKLKLSTTFPLINSKSKKLTGGAVQNYTFLILLPLIVLSLPYSSNSINYRDRVWQQVIRLIEICQIASSYSIHYNQLTHLDYLILEYLQERKNLFPNKKLLRKHHYLQHYSYYIREFGPLMGFTTLRFESKHQFFKNVVRSTRNFINVTLSLSRHHQMYQVSIQNSKKDPSIIPSTIFKLNSSHKTFIDLKCEFRTPCIIYHEIKYKENYFVVIGRNNFGNILSLKIENIFFNEHFTVILLNGLVHILDFDSLNGSYKLQPTESYSHISISELVSPIPFSSCIINNELRTSLKYSFPLFF